MGVEADFLGDHRFALGDRLCTLRLADFEDDLLCFFGVAGEMNVPAGRPHPFFIALDVEVEMGKDMVLDVARGIAQRLEFREPVGGELPFFDETLPHIPKGLLQLPVRERARRVVLEMR